MIDVLELIGDGDIAADSSVILTYELDLPIYEGWVRRRLSAAGAGNQVVFCDLQIHEREMEGLATARHIGRTYSLTPVRRTGAFHPKVCLLLGRMKGRLLVGSGNVTVGGLLRNAELFGRFDYERQSGAGPHEAFGAVWSLIEELARGASDVVQKQIARAASWAPWIREAPTGDGRTLLIGGHGRSALAAQIGSLLGRAKAKSAVVVSASFDRRLGALTSLANLTAQRRVRCIVQPGSVELDGKAVERLKGVVQWYPFVDPYPREKRKRRDVRLHAKLIVLDCSDRELVVYGSANASRPALLDEDANSEVVVAWWHTGPKSMVERLGLDRSLASKRIDGELMDKRWRAESDGEPRREFQCILAGAVAYGRCVELTITEGKPPRDAVLEIGEGVNRPPLLRAPIREGEGGRFEASGAVPEGARVARVGTRGGRPLSNFVAFTSPALAEVHGRSGIRARAEGAIAAMQDGVVLGTVLFELLNYYRDFEVIMARPGGEPQRPPEEGGSTDVDVGPRAVETFYTDATADQSASEIWIGDRADLDLLAALVQPLRVVPSARTLDEEEDDSAIEEEAERREIDVKRGGPTGDERRESSRFASRAALERAARRLASRLKRSATSIEDALAMRKEAVGVRATSIARQIWMTHIAAFLAERQVLSAENEEVRCLDARSFAQYVLRVCRALAGGKDGGVLSMMRPDTWAGPDADTLRRGLAFLWTCCVWATAHLREERPEELESVWEAVPELVTGRFVAAVSGHCKAPDTHDITRRLPACRDPAELEAWERRISGLADVIRSTEGKGRRGASVNGLRGGTSAAEPGALVFHPAVGVTVLFDREPWAHGTYSLLDLSKSDDLVRGFVDGVVELRVEGWPLPWDESVARSLELD